MGRTTQAVKRALAPVLSPATARYRAAHAQLSGIEQRSQVLNDQVAVLLQRLVELEGGLRVDAAVLGEFSSASRRIVSQLEARLDELADVTAARRAAEAGMARSFEATAVVAALAGVDPPATLLVIGPEAAGLRRAVTSLGYAVTDDGGDDAGPYAAAVVVLEAGDDASAVDRARGGLAPGGRLVLARRVDTPPDPGGALAFVGDDLAALAGGPATRERVYACRRDGNWTLVPGGRADVDWASTRSALMLVSATSS